MDYNYLEKRKQFLLKIITQKEKEIEQLRKELKTIENKMKKTKKILRTDGFTCTGHGHSFVKKQRCPCVEN